MDEAHDTFRSSTMGWLWGTMAGLATILLALGGFVATVVGAGGGRDWGAWPLLLTVAALLVVLFKWIQYMGALYELTDQRLIVRRGIFMKSIDEIELYRIKDVRMDFSLINQWAGIGRVCLTSSDETTRGGDLVMRDIPNARARREEIRRLVDTARRQRGVREIDMVREDV
jgi:uncharacterized membrane protein YdbT with pleckstrin-like domain